MRKMFSKRVLEEYSNATRLLFVLGSLMDTLVNTGDGLPEELWEYTDELSDCIEKVHGEVFQYLRSIDKTDDYPF